MTILATRRDILRTGAATGAAFATLLLVRPVMAKPEEMEAAIRAFTGSAPVAKGKVELVLPALVENGNSVPLAVNVAHWMEPNDYVKTIAIFNEKNPQPNVASLHLSPRCGRAVVSTRIRLGDSQNIVAIAQLSDGTFWSDTAELIVTLPACAET